jgi:hypothetical protein
MSVVLPDSRDPPETAAFNLRAGFSGMATGLIVTKLRQPGFVGKRARHSRLCGNAHRTIE